MSISKKDLNVLLAAIGIMVAMGVYFWVFQPFMEKADRLEAENADLRARVEELNIMNAKKEDFQRDTAAMNAKITEIFDQFPADVYPEDAIAENIAMEAVSGVLNTALKIEEPLNFYAPLATSPEEIQTDAFADVTESSESDEDTTASTETAAPASGLAAMALPVKYFFTCDLEGAEKACAFVNSQDNRDVISGLALTYDESTGTLKGELLVVKNYITGTNKPHVPAIFPNVVTGTSDPFGTRAFQFISAGDNGIVNMGDEQTQNAEAAPANRQ